MLTTLMKLGLSEKEAKVYLAALELAQDTVQNIAKKASVNRPTTYVILDSLIKIGLVCIIEEAGRTKYCANSPHELTTILKRREREVVEEQNELLRTMPQLEALFNSSDIKPAIRYYSGYEGQLAMREDAADTADEEIYSFVDLDNLFKAFPKYDEEQEKGRVERKRKSRVIFTSINGKDANRNDKEMMRVSRFIPKDKFPLGGSVTIHPEASRLYISIYKEQFLGIVIESKDISKMFMVIWQLSWEAAEKYN